MAQTKGRREKGTGTIWQKENGTWMGRIGIGTGADGKRKFKSFSGKTESEVKRKIREYNKSEHVDPNKTSMETYVYNWLTTYKKNTIKDTSYDALEKTVRNYVVPNLGYIRLQELTSDDIQKMLQSLKDAGYSHSTVKKAYNCMGELMRHAVIRGDIIRDPMAIAQNYAVENRLAMMDKIVSGMGLDVVEMFATIHNYIDMDNLILRKGAVSAQRGEKLIIPINMRDGSLICTGKGNADWNFSAPHGAGRLMSRSAAKERFTVEEFEKQMKGIFTI